MPEWLQVTIGILGGIVTASTVFKILLTPAFKLVDRVKKLEAHLEADYKRGIRSDKMAKAQVKALLALISHQISGNDIEVMKTVQKELQDNLTELI